MSSHLTQKRCRSDFSVELKVPIELEADQDYKEKKPPTLISRDM